MFPLVRIAEPQIRQTTVLAAMTGLMVKELVSWLGGRSGLLS